MYCGLFNTSGDTEPKSMANIVYIGSLDDKTHETDGATGGFILVGLYFGTDSFRFDEGFSGLFYSGCRTWGDNWPDFGSQYYYFL